MCFRTNQIFLQAGLPKDQINEATKAWDQQLEQELLSIESPKLAIPKPDGSIRGIIYKSLQIINEIRRSIYNFVKFNMHYTLGHRQIHLYLITKEITTFDFHTMQFIN
jgi:hypothetical protein